MDRIQPHENAIQQLTGAYAALFTPFDAANRIDYSIVRQMIRFQLEMGLKGFFVGGTTGEGLLLSTEEREELVENVVAICREDPFCKDFDATVIAHVGHPSTDVASRLAVSAAKAGADWIGAIGPIFYGVNFSSALRHYGQIAAATDLPFMLYSFQNSIQPERDKQLLDLPNVAGMKYTGADFFSVQQLSRLYDRPMAWVSGMDEQFVAGQTMGFQAGIGSTYNFAPQYYATMYELCQNNQFEQASAMQYRINRATYLMTLYENWSARKAFMRYIGIDCGSCRAPFAPFADNEYRQLEIELDKLDVLTKDHAHTLKGWTAAI